MYIHDLKPSLGEKTTSKRLGRGIGSGLGKTSGKGHKGQNARSGGGVRPGFEGGQMPLIRRLPKRGFKNHFRTEYEVINLSKIEASEAIKSGAVLSVEDLLSLGLLRAAAAKSPVKVLADGSITKKIELHVNAASKKAKEAIEAAGGSVIIK